MDNPGIQVLVWILALVALVYVFFAIYSIIVLFDFRDKLRKRLVALSVLFAEKKEILLSLYDLYLKAKLPISPEIKTAKKKVAALPTEAKSEEEVMTIATALNDFQRRLALLAEEERYILRHQDSISYTNSLKDLENNYHRIVAAYNTDLNGYEYWRKRFVYRWLTWIFGFRKRQRLA
ncbi:MAG: hypothetical protein WCS90_02060 [Bacilli bacterium]